MLRALKIEQSRQGEMQTRVKSLEEKVQQAEGQRNLALIGAAIATLLAIVFFIVMLVK